MDNKDYLVAYNYLPILIHTCFFAAQSAQNPL